MQASGSPRKAKEEKVPKWQKEREKRRGKHERLLYLYGLQWKTYIPEQLEKRATIITSKSTKSA